jgi:hypothetical protein
MFHLFDGWFFRREDDNVYIEKRESAEVDSALVISLQMTIDDWKSIVDHINADELKAEE